LIHFKEKKKLVKLIIHLGCDENQLSRAHEHHSPMLTTTLAFEEWTEIVGSERLTGARLDRLTHRCHILEANAESFRLRPARKRSTSKAYAEQDSNQGKIKK
jgi:hypothetical protein